jgi:histidine triad (HIT) family protein
MISDEEAKEIKQKLLQQIEKLPQEQVQGLKDKIDGMNKEDLEDFVKQNTKGVCIFCQILQGKVQSYRVFETDNFVAILDIMPATKGHTIILPRKHVEFLTELSNDEYHEMFAFARKIIPTLMSVTGANSVDFYLNQGKQRVPHLALNLIPRYEKDEVNFTWKKDTAKERELQDLSLRISSALGKVMEREEQKRAAEKQEEEESEAQQLMKHTQERIP